MNFLTFKRIMSSVMDMEGDFMNHNFFSVEFSFLWLKLSVLHPMICCVWFILS